MNCPIYAVHAWTDYPIVALGDEPNKEAPVRPCTVIAYDGGLYVTVDVGGVRAQFKSGYCYARRGAYGEGPAYRHEFLDRLPRRPSATGFAEGAACCIRCGSMGMVDVHLDGTQHGLCWGGHHSLAVTPIVHRVRRVKVVQVPAQWVGQHTTKKTLRDRKSTAKAKKRTMRDANGKVVSKASMRREKGAER